jgi:hypothetical protein
MIPKWIGGVSGALFDQRLSRLSGIFRGPELRIYGPDFEQKATVQTRVALSDLYGLVETLRENEPVAANRFFGFTEWPVCDHLGPPDRFAAIGEPLSWLHFSFVSQSIIPEVKLVDGVLDFIPREGFVPLPPANYQVFRCRRWLADHCSTFHE